jgi:hypothetical protein
VFGGGDKQEIFETKRYEIPSSCFLYLGNFLRFGHIDATIGSIMMNSYKTHTIYIVVKNVNVVARKKLPLEK